MNVRNVLEWLEAAAASAPDRAAYDAHGDRLTWRETAGLARFVGGFLASRIPAQSPVLILMDKSPACVTAMLGAVYAGCFYTPLDASMPPARMRLIREKLNPAVILCEDKYRQTAEAIAEGAPVYAVSDLRGLPDPDLLSQRRKNHLDTDLLYVLFTSGSTGTPKGVAITHQSVIDFVEWACDALRLPVGCRFGSQAPFYFDNSVLDIYCAMRQAGSVFLINKSLFMFPGKLLEELCLEKIDTIFWVPSALTAVASSGALLSHSLPDVKRVFFCGEVMPCRTMNLWRQALPDADFVNMYGPTEITDVCAWYRVERDFADTDALPIGFPCANTRIDLVDGEICVSGVGLSPGYYRDPEKTAAAFTVHPFLPMQRMYRTGDLGEYNDRGEILFLGRRDSQIKRSGYRIELGEIEAALMTAEGVLDGCCVYDPAKEKILCAWAGEAEEKALKAHLKTRLPKYMLPDLWMRLSALPKTGSGKTDRLHVKRMYDDEHTVL